MVKKYRVIQKIKAFGLEVGDVFECDDTGYCFREYGNGERIECPTYLLKDHPDWFTPLSEEECPCYKTIYHQPKHYLSPKCTCPCHYPKPEDKIEELVYDDESDSIRLRILVGKINEIIRELNKRRTI